MTPALEFEITPEPEPDEEAALVAAVQAALALDGAFEAPSAYRSAWRRAGGPEAADAETP